MQFMTKEVVINNTLMCLYSCVHIVPRANAKFYRALPDKESIAAAKNLYGKVGMPRAQTLIDAIQMVETENRVLSFFFLLLDRRGPIPATDDEDLDALYDAQALYNAPFFSFGDTEGEKTVLGDLIVLSNDENFTHPNMSAPGGLLDYFIKESIDIISRSTCEGCS